MQLLKHLLAAAIVASAMLPCAVREVAAQADDQKIDDPEIGDTVNDVLDVRGFKVPLPDGDWSVYFVKADDHPAYPRIDVSLILHQQGVVKQTADVTIARALRNDGFKPYRGCERRHYHHTVVTQNRHGLRQACWHLRPVDLALSDRPPAALQALSEFARERRLYLPVVLVGVRFHHANRGGAMRVAFNWNPDLILHAGRQKKYWIYADWTKDGVALDARKAAVIDTLQVWAEDRYPDIESAFATGVGASQ